MKKSLIIFFTLFLSFLCFHKILSKSPQSLPPGLPEDINGYKKWTRLNKKIIKPRPSDPHRGFKRVFVNREQNELTDSNKNLIFPYKEGTIIVKEVRESTKRKSKIVLISIMRKLSGNDTTEGWDFIEYISSGADNSFSVINFPKESCFSCHQGASDSDSVWTKFDNFKKARK